MLEGFDENGNLRGVKVSENGELHVIMNGGSGSGQGGGSTIIQSNETTLSAGIITAGTTEQTIGVAKKVTEISIANCSETANITVSVGQKNFVVAPNLAVDLPINNTVTEIGITSTEADTKVQYVVKGEEE